MLCFRSMKRHSIYFIILGQLIAIPVSVWMIFGLSDSSLGFFILAPFVLMFVTTSSAVGFGMWWKSLRYDIHKVVSEIVFVLASYTILFSIFSSSIMLGSNIKPENLTDLTFQAFLIVLSPIAISFFGRNLRPYQRLGLVIAAGVFIFYFPFFIF